jgi:hypothetical protein
MVAEEVDGSAAMWVPASAAEIEQAVTNRALDENAYFDAKRELGKNKELAKDVAAMANNGGVFIYGVDEDECGRPTVLAPVALTGLRERVDSVIRTSIAEPPTIQVHERPLDDDLARGYLVVAVPASPRAPHMVVADKDYRYYQRLETMSVPMTEGEVARLYERRQRWEVDRARLLRETVERDHRIWPPDRERADLHIIVRPVAASGPSLLEQASGDQRPQDFLLGLLGQAQTRAAFRVGAYQPDLSSQGGWTQRDGGWRAGSYLVGMPGQPREMVVDLTITDEGRAYLFCGDAAAHMQPGDQYLTINDDLIAGLTARTLLIVGKLYEAAPYLGLVDVGIAVTGITGYMLYSSYASYANSYPQVRRPLARTEDYERTERVLAHELATDPRRIARSLALPFLNQVSGGVYDPFQEQGR